jgi:hypothetical protein
MTFHPFTVRHDPSGDEAEADTREAATLAARTLLEDNDWNGQCLVLQGKKVLDMVWADDDSHYTHLNTCHQD